MNKVGLSTNLEVEIIGKQLCFSVLGREDVEVYPPADDGHVEISVLTSEENMRYVAEAILYRLSGYAYERGGKGKNKYMPFIKWRQKLYVED